MISRGYLVGRRLVGYERWMVERVKRLEILLNCHSKHPIFDSTFHRNTSRMTELPLCESQAAMNALSTTENIKSTTGYGCLN